ncbi:MAG: ribosomal RNA small subunit methyltransferase A [Clostridia bacterium]|nr:ribosomal RNA small subunit methyltransferase A [Clostridia bacterium]
MSDKDLLQKHNFKFQKKYGQNFLYDPKIPAKIAENCTESEFPEDGKKQEVIVEIGPGAGILTKELAKRFHRVSAVEIDENLIPILAESLADFDNVTVTNKDIMQVDLPEFVKEITEDGKYPVSVCANLPYYITTPVIMKLIEECCGFGYITVMVQKEVARRLCAKPESADYGSITAEIGLYGGAVKLFDVPAGCFNPRPKVDSAVVRIKLEQPEKYPKADARNASILIKAAFGQRRKTLVNALSGLAGKIKTTDKNELAEIISQTLGVPGDVRGEKLTADQFVTLARALF